MVSTFGLDPKKWHKNGCCNDAAAMNAVHDHAINVRELDAMNDQIQSNLQDAIDNDEFAEKV